MRLGTVQLHVVKALGGAPKGMAVGDLVDSYEAGSRESGYATMSRALSSLRKDGLVEKVDDSYSLTERGYVAYKELFPTEWKSTYSKNIHAAIQLIAGGLPNPERDTQIQKIVFAYLCRHGQSSVSEISEATGLNLQQCGYILAVLIDLGLVDDRGDDMSAVSERFLSDSFDAAVKRKKQPVHATPMRALTDFGDAAR